MHWSYCYVDQVADTQLQSVYQQLSPTRKAHIDSLHKPEDRARSLAAQWLLQQLLREHYGITGAVLHRHPNGQPYLTGCDLHISISHSHHLVACAVDAAPIGLDVERLRPVSPALCGGICTPEEKVYLLAGAEEFPAQENQTPEFLQRFFRIWTAKEAYFKKCGTGITDLRSVNTCALFPETHQIEDYILQVL